MFSRNSPIAMMTNKISAESPNPCVTERWESLSSAIFFIDQKFKKRTESFLLGQRFWKWAKHQPATGVLGWTWRPWAPLLPPSSSKRSFLKVNQICLWQICVTEWLSCTKVHRIFRWLRQSQSDSPANSRISRAMVKRKASIPQTAHRTVLFKFSI